ncbi:hypothetical protein TSOC_002075 [Tetrabaena socialis]|uniref:Proliferating cell nuclear antigen n=1 Tax=Tetrabaena socialis TaxID=47790 RepID=A0A2J8AF24_9CHLO|nr:hypothetical protein TSOC_002075 [Tetrabaena socialis]|eukprot:PNH11096.1 hypothetical protein TSOC_002075 [Tetrabaena socialis]
MQTSLTAFNRFHWRSGGGRNYVLNLSVSEADEESLVLEVKAAAGGLTKCTRHAIALLTPATDVPATSVDGSSFAFSSGALFEGSSPRCSQRCVSSVGGSDSLVLADVKSSGCDEVALTLAQESLVLSGRAGDNCSELRVALEGVQGGALSLMAEQGPVRAAFKARHLLRLAALCGEASSLLLQLGLDTPLSATFKLQGGGVVQVFTAPVADDEEADREGDGGVKVAKAQAKGAKKEAKRTRAAGSGGEGSEVAGHGSWRGGCDEGDEGAVAYERGASEDEGDGGKW